MKPSFTSTLPLLLVGVIATSQGYAQGRLVKAETLSGTVTDVDGKPLSAAGVHAYPCDPKERGEMATSGSRTTTDANGHFSFVDWNRQQRTCITATVPGFMFQADEVVYESGAGQLSFALHRLEVPSAK